MPENLHRYWITFFILAVASSAYGQAGDFNGDGAYDCDDINQLTTEVSSGQNSLNFDLNADGQVDRSDVSEWLITAGNINRGEPYLLGDVNLDGDVNAPDYSGRFNGSIFETNSHWCDGDINADGRVDVSDGLLIQTNTFQPRDPDLSVGEGEMLIESDLAAFIYDPSEGNMYIRSEVKLTGMTISGPPTTGDVAFSSGFQDGIAWWSVYAFGKQQWIGHVLTFQSENTPQGSHLLAQYESGLSESDFGIVEYGAHYWIEDLEGVLSTSVQFDSVLPGDANLDGFVDVADFNAWNENKFTDAASWGEGDFNHDGIVDVSDFNLWNANKFTSAGWDDPPTVVPEPGGLLLAFFALAAVFSRSQCRRYCSM